jgi:hypothetical protein
MAFIAPLQRGFSDQIGASLSLHSYGLTEGCPGHTAFRLLDLCWRPRFSSISAYHLL